MIADLSHLSREGGGHAELLTHVRRRGGQAVIPTADRYVTPGRADPER